MQAKQQQQKKADSTLNMEMSAAFFIPLPKQMTKKKTHGSSFLRKKNETGEGPGGDKASRTAMSVQTHTSPCCPDPALFGSITAKTA